MFYEICKFIFYIFGFFAIFYEFWCIKNTEKVIEVTNKAKKSMKDKSIEFTSIELAFGCLQCLYCLWTVVGIFSSQWAIFITIIILSLFKGSLMFQGKAWYRFDAGLTIGLVLLAILNTYHFHISILQLIKSL